MFKPLCFLLPIFFCPLLLSGQTKMRPLNELINKVDPGWPIVKKWIDSATNKVEILPADITRGANALYKTQVTTRSTMGAIVYHTGGLLIDNGWLRILGSGSTKLNRSLPDWNKGKAYSDSIIGAPFLLIADDAIGGFFLLNGGGLGPDLGKVYYLDPGNLEYESLEINYSEFLLFCLNTNLEDFYEGLRWIDWKNDVTSLDGNKAFSFYPFLWSKEGKDINNVSRKAVPIEEIYLLTLDVRKQLGLDK
jgi:hypothetical protein